MGGRSRTAQGRRMSDGPIGRSRASGSSFGRLSPRTSLGFRPRSAMPSCPLTRDGDFARRTALCEAMDRSYRPPAEAGVVLASLTRSNDGSSMAVDQCGPRRDLYSAAQLLDLVLCLADRLTAIEHAQRASRRRAEG